MNTRLCPNCNSEINYSTKYNLARAIRQNDLCRKCSCQKTSQQNVRLGKLKGKNNPNFGKKFSEEHRKNISENHWNSSGSKNPMFGKSFYDCWVEKYGKETADEKLIVFKKKQSEINSGKNNRMFGKPSPQGSGNGWSGWYKGWYFRSLLELSYMIKVIERFNLPWKSAECKEFAIPYINWNGEQRTYFADFVISNKYLVECKPRRLHNTPNVLAKKEGAKLACKKLGLTYKLRFIKMLSDGSIKTLVERGQIKFLPRYEEKFKQRCNPNSSSV